MSTLSADGIINSVKLVIEIANNSIAAIVFLVVLGIIAGVWDYRRRAGASIRSQLVVLLLAVIWMIEFVWAYNSVFDRMIP